MSKLVKSFWHKADAEKFINGRSGFYKEFKNLSWRVYQWEA